MKKSIIFILFIVISAIVFEAQAQLLTNEQLKAQKIFSTLDEALKTPDKVIVLDLSGDNTFSALPASVEKFTNLQKLTLGKNQIMELPKTIGKLSKLQILVLNDNKISALPEEICLLANLHTLDLGYTKIKELPAGFSKLQSLKILDLSWNDLTVEKLANVFLLKQLTVLNLQRNQVETLPATIANLEKLEVLNLNFNPLASLPKEIGALKKLTDLDLSENIDLKIFPDEIYEFKNLESLNLKGISISDEQKNKLLAAYPKDSDGNSIVNFGDE